MTGRVNTAALTILAALQVAALARILPLRQKPASQAAQAFL
jgi:hypothetical protein